MTEIAIVGRSSSHFTRTARLFALELGVTHTFRPVLDLMSLDVSEYAGNPALKIPVLVDEGGPVFGTENICRELLRRSGVRGQVVLPGDVGTRHVVNAEEMTRYLMEANVWLILTKLSGAPEPPKLRRGVENVLTYLDGDLDRVLDALPADRVLSYVETALSAQSRTFRFAR